MFLGLDSALTANMQHEAIKPAFYQALWTSISYISDPGLIRHVVVNNNI